MVKNREIVVLGMGGTIAGRAASAADNVGYVAGEVPVETLVSECVGNLLVTSACTLHCEQVVQKDSKDMGFSDWLQLSQRIEYHLGRDAVCGVVVTHGTDTLEEGAYFLHLGVDRRLQCEKPVALTCAMRPSTSLAPDGPQNLRDAVAVVMDRHASGVVVVCAGEVHSAAHVRKTHTYRPQAFSSVGGGVLGYVEEGHVRWVGAQPRIDQGRFRIASAPARWPRVEILTSYANGSVDLLLAMLQYVGADGPLDGLVLAGTGNGTLSVGLERALQGQSVRGLPIVLVSRCADGALIGDGHGVPAYASGQVVSAYQARIGLVLRLLAESAVKPAP